MKKLLFLGLFFMPLKSWAVNYGFTVTSTTTIAMIETAFTDTYGYQATIPDPANPGQTITNPETITQFINRMIKNKLVRDMIVQWKTNQINNQDLIDRINTVNGINIP